MKKRHEKGFTLIEVLIVVVILGILAALILPRMLQQPEKARIAEANQFLGVLRRAQINYADTTSSAYLAVGSVTTAATTNNEWQRLGMNNLSTSSSFSYSCTTAACTATRNALYNPPSSLAGGTIAINLDSGAFTCAGGYVLAGSSCVTPG